MKAIKTGTVVQIKCPECGKELVVRENRYNHKQFLGCTGYPECKYSQEIPEAWVLEYLGQPKLF